MGRISIAILAVIFAQAAPIRAAESESQIVELTVADIQFIQKQDALLKSIEDWRYFIGRAAPSAQDFLPRLAVLDDEAMAVENIAGLEGPVARFRALEMEMKARVLPGWEQMTPAERDAAVNGLLSKIKIMISLQRTQVHLGAEQGKTLDKIRTEVLSSEDPQALAELYDRIQRYGAGDSPIVSAQAVGEIVGNLERYLPRNQLPPGLHAHSAMDVPDISYNADKEMKALLIGRRSGMNTAIIRKAMSEGMRQGVDYRLVLSVIKAESAFDPDATSPKGARGLMQIMPDTGKQLGVSKSSMLYDVDTNLHAGVKYLKQLLNTFTDFSAAELATLNPAKLQQVKSVIASYNAGPNAVKRYGGVPPYRETRDYVVRVLQNYSAFCRQFPQ
ncbi:MAG: lytic transglycosylase domain-containing protein [Elusimicrobiota bacterium]